jgi:hypothetical protein
MLHEVYIMSSSIYVLRPSDMLLAASLRRSLVSFVHRVFVENIETSYSSYIFTEQITINFFSDITVFAGLRIRRATVPLFERLGLISRY